MASQVIKGNMLFFSVESFEMLNFREQSFFFGRFIACSVATIVVNMWQSTAMRHRGFQIYQ